METEIDVGIYTETKQPLPDRQTDRHSHPYFHGLRRLGCSAATVLEGSVALSS